MPLAVGVIPPPSTPVVVEPTPVSTGQGAGTMRATWTDPDGQVFELTGPHDVHGWLTRPQIGGWGAAPVTIVTDPLARGGVSVRHQRAEPRRITWPLHIFGDTHMQFLGRYRTLMRAITLTKYKGAGVLTVWRPDGTARAIDCLYEDGFGGEPGENWVSANPVLTLFCPDGYWRDVTAQVVRRAYGNSVPYLSPYLTVSSAQVLGSTTVTNPGDVPSWPSWTIIGPTEQAVATNTTTGESWTLNHTLAAGQQATIVVEPTRALVRGNAGENLVDKLSWPGAVLWSLLPGLNQVTFQLNGSVDGSSIEMSYFPRYETA